MCKICIFAGTTEARRLVELLSTQPVSVTACVATEYGETLLPEGGNVTVRSGRIPVDGIIQMLSDTKFDLVIDATHPYAASITESAARACAETGTEYLRLLREESDKVSDFTCVLNAEAAALFLSKTDGNILLTTGSKDLKMYSKVKDFTDRAYARVLPLDASLALCREAGVQPSHILAMQGPFSEEMNVALIHASDAKWLVTKDTGEAGGLPAKLAAAKRCGCRVLLIDRPQEDGMTPDAVRDLLLGEKPPRFPLFVDLTDKTCVVVGCGAIGAHRAEVLLRYGARVIVVAPEGEAPAGAQHIRRAFEPQDIRGAFLVTAATNNHALNHEIYELCQRERIFISTADDRTACSFFFPAVRTGNGLSVGLVSDGSDHKKTARTAKKIEAILKEEQE